MDGAMAGRPPERNDGEVIVLCYHALSPSWTAALSVTPEQFEFQIGLLASRGYQGVRFTEAALGERAGKVVAVTFDDAYRSVIELARPVLDRYGFPGTVFVPTTPVGNGEPLAWEGTDQWLGGPHEDELAPMSWEQLRSLADAGWEIGSHTLTHPRLPGLGDAELRAQLIDSKQVCEREMSRECTSIAFPYGDSDQRVVETAMAAGYSAAAMLTDTLERVSRFECPRIGVYNVDGQQAFRLKVSPNVRRLRRSRAWVPVAKLLHSLRPG